MTTFIHLDTAETDVSILYLRRTAEYIYDRAEYLYGLLTQVEWEGSSKDIFIDDLYRCVSTLRTLSDSLDSQGFQLSQELERWVGVAASFNH